jgi:RNA polymerase sigma-70 factor (ECF subfamily)
LLRAGVPQSEAEELLQDVLATLSQRLKKGAAKGSIRKLVAKITRGRVLNRARDRERQPDTVALPSSGSALPESGGDVDRAVDVRKLALAFLHELPDDLQAVVREAVLGDRSDAEAAEALGLPVGTVKSRIRKAIAQLKALGTPSGRDAAA